MMHAKPERPVPFQGDLCNLPEALDPLKEKPNWVVWRYEWKVNDKGIGNWTKRRFALRRICRLRGLLRGGSGASWDMEEDATGSCGHDWFWARCNRRRMGLGCRGGGGGMLFMLGGLDHGSGNLKLWRVRVVRRNGQFR